MKYQDFLASLAEQARGNVHKKNSVTGRRLHEEVGAPPDQGPMLVGDERPAVSGVLGRLAYQLMDAIKQERSLPPQDRQIYLKTLQQLVQRVYAPRPALGQAEPVSSEREPMGTWKLGRTA